MPLKVYRSSAGSGKTTTLVNEYLEMLMKPNGNFKSILAITFTNKAAGEMKERILHALGQIAASADPSQLNPALSKQISEIQKTYDLQYSDIRDKAGRQLSHILHQYGSFAVSTIDKFTHQLIRNFAFDLKVPTNFAVELDTEMVVKSAVDYLLEDVGQNELVTRMLIEFLLERIDEEKNIRVEEDLVKLGKLMYSEKGLPRLPYLAKLSAEDFSKLREKLYAEIKKVDSVLLNSANEIGDLIKRAGILPEEFFYGQKGYPGALKKITMKDYSGFESPRFLDLCNDGVFYTNKASAETIGKFEPVKDIIQKKSLEMLGYWNGHASRYYLLKVILKNFYALALLSEIKEGIDKHRKAEGILPIAEFNHLISQAITLEPAPFIFERIGNRFTELCIDEFQDTSVKQWENLMPLAENVLSTDGTVLLVGDSKQSIYRFRGGEANQLNVLPNLLNKDFDWLEEREFLFKQHFIPRTLNYNFRSKSEIIDFNNTFFRHVISTVLPAKKNDFPDGALERLTLTYNDVEQECGKKKSGGEVRIQVLPAVAGQRAAEKMESRILELKNQVDYYVGLGYQWKDITILLRGNIEAGDFAAGLMSHGIKVISRESVRVKESYKVGLLMDGLRWFLDPANEPAGLNILNFLSLREKQIPLDHRFLNGKFGWKSFLAEHRLNWAPEEWNYLPLPSLLNRMSVFLGFNSEKDVFLSFFMEAVIKFYQKGKGGIREFIQWWDEKSDTLNIVIPEGVNAVQLLTVHKSKGLQFKVVILPGADRFDANKNNNGNPHWLTLNPEENYGLSLAIANHSKDLTKTPFAGIYHEEVFQTLVDNLNLYYVAFTRAEEHLSLMTHEKEPGVLNSWINSYLENSFFHQDEKGIFVYGKPQKQETVGEVSGESNSITDAGVYDRRDILEDYRWAFPEESGEIESLELGLLVHAMFSKIVAPSDLQHAAQQFILLNPVWKEKISGITEWMLKDERLAMLWDASYSILNEQDILLPGGKSTRPDRLMISGKKVRIFDYKTGKKRESHADQLRDYANVLRDMGFEVEKLALIYVELQEIVLL